MTFFLKVVKDKECEKLTNFTLLLLDYLNHLCLDI